ncbi:MAG: hypothetical protein ACOYEV_04480 [Candidatus Nanopelagicales bacterium]
MRPSVKQAQKLPPGTPRIANPRTRAGVAALNALARIGSTPLVGRIGAKLFTPPTDNVELPDQPLNCPGAPQCGSSCSMARRASARTTAAPGG